MGIQDTLKALADPIRREILNLLDVYKRQVRAQLEDGHPVRRGMLNAVVYAQLSAT